MSANSAPLSLRDFMASDQNNVDTMDMDKGSTTNINSNLNKQSKVNVAHLEREAGAIINYGPRA